MDGRKAKDLTGKRFGNLTVIERDCKSDKNRNVYWKCRCDCGNYTVVQGRHLRNGATKSCGCLHNKVITEKLLKDLSGHKFGRLTVIERTCNDDYGNTYWICKCDCGNYSIVRGAEMRFGRILSCGCLRDERTVETHKKHGMSEEKIHGVWQSMKQRCFNENDKSYSNYGGRGITVCGDWKDDFQSFYDWSMANGYREGLSIDRIDVNGNYEPSNCRWATDKEQANNKRTCRYLTYGGETLTLTEWAEKVGMKPYTLRNRIRKGWTVERALTEPVKQRSAIKAVNK